MMRKAISIGIVSLFAIGGLVGILSIVPEDVEAPGPTYVSGIISMNTTWTVADSPYIVVGNVLVEQNFSLTIEPGVEVRFDLNMYLRIEGTLNAVGNETSMIIFTSNSTSPVKGDWSGIRIMDTSVDSVIKYCRIEYGGPGINNAANDLIVSHSEIINNSADWGGIYNSGSANIFNNTIFKNYADLRGGGIWNEGTASIRNNTIFENSAGDGGGGIYNTGSGVIEFNIIYGNFANSDWGGGIYNFDSGTAILNDNIVTDNSAIDGNGGGVGNLGAMILTNSTIKDNYASGYGGGVMESNVYGGTTTILYCEIINNSAAYDHSGGIHGSPIINNCIITKNIGWGITGDGSINNNTIICNTKGGIRGNPSKLEYNNIIHSIFNIYLTASSDVYAYNNWWGTTNTDIIDEKIYDYYDHFSLGKVFYIPILTGASPNAPEIPPDCGSGLQPGAPWPMFRQNLNHTGLSPYDTSGNPGELIWSFETIGNDFIDRSSPAIDSNGTIYIGSTDSSASSGYLYAINPDGTEKWSFTPGNNFHIERSSPAISSDGTIYIGSDDHKMYAINPDGTEKWNYTTGERIWSSPAVSSDGTIYIGSDDNKLYAINPDGTEKWSFITGHKLWSSPAIGIDGTIYIGSFDNKLYAINPNGTEKWNFIADGPVWSSPAIGSDGTIYIGTTGDKLYAINSDGTEKWSVSIGWNVRSPAIGPDATIYFSSESEKIHAIYPNGTEKWRFNIGYAGDSIPTIGSDGTIYVGSDDGELCAINPDGTEKWSFLANSSVESSPAINSDGTIYVGSTDGKLYAIGDAPNQPPSILATVPNQIRNEDSAPWTLDLTSYEDDVEDSGVDLNWYLTDLDTSFYFVTGMNSSDDVLIFTPLKNAYGNDEVILWLEDSGGEKASQVMWINVTSVNDIPIIDECPDISIIYNTTITVDYTPYIDDIDTPLSELILTTDDPTHASISGLSITYIYPESMVDQVVSVNITVSDGEGTDSDQITVSIVDEEIDTDEDGIPDSEDPDDDNDDYNDEDDFYPKDPTRWSLQTDVSIAEITLSKYGPAAGEEVTIYVEIQNSGNNDCDVIVKYYDGDPDDGGTQIGSDHEITISSDSSISVTQTWIAIAGNHTLYVIVEDLATDEEVSAYLPIIIGANIQPVLVLTTGDINIYRFEPGQERTISVEVTCYRQSVNNVHLVVLDDQNLTIDHTITPPLTMTDGETTKFYLRIKAPQLPEGVEKLEKDILIQAVGDNGIFSNAEELDIVVSQSAVTFLNPITIAGAVVTGSLATLGAAAAASRRNENWKYLLLLTFAVPLYTRIHGKKTLDNFVRGQVYGHIQSKPGTHFNEIRKTLKLGNGNLAYHLRKLEKEGFIISKRDKRYRRFYPVGVEVPEEDGIKLSKTQENILDFIERYPKSNQKEIAKSLKESQQTISYNINVLVREGFLKEEKIEGTKNYEIFDENT